MGNDDLLRAIHDRATLLRLRRLLEALDPAAPPDLRLVYPEALVPPPRRLGVLPGSFNPLTRAHAALAARGLATGLELVVFALARRTVDKEQVDGAALEDRLLVLMLYASRHPGHAVAALNRGLYVEQAEAFRRALPDLEDLVFLVGFDKIVQVFDPKYYADRRAALDRLFALARFLVAPRGALGERDLADLLARPENRAYADRVAYLDLDPAYRDLASTGARAALAAGRIEAAGLTAEAEAFVRATGAYAAPGPGPDGARQDRYARRLAWLSTLA